MCPTLGPFGRFGRRDRTWCGDCPCSIDCSMCSSYWLAILTAFLREPITATRSASALSRGRFLDVTGGVDCRISPLRVRGSASWCVGVVARLRCPMAEEAKR